MKGALESRRKTRSLERGFVREKVGFEFHLSSRVHIFWPVLSPSNINGVLLKFLFKERALWGLFAKLEREPYSFEHMPTKKLPQV